ncbi:MAG: CRTAC1 family protein, partial [Xanthomonadales bacterium]|nr:CRTAC1 family protein [Xanthomonadales bacterium]
GTFDEVGAEAGIHVVQADGAPVGKGLALLTEDLDGDGWIDVIVANDTVRNFVFRNRAGAGFEEVGESWGLAYDRNGMATGAMGIDLAEPYGDGRAAIAIGNFANEMTSLYLRQGTALQFADEAMVSGVGPDSRRALSFGLLFADLDLDGRLDLVQANGHVEDEIQRVQASQHYAQPAQVFWQCGSGCRRRFIAEPANQLGDLGQPSVGRGLVSADFDGDGDLDLVLTQVAGPPRVLRNDLPQRGHWIALRLSDAGAVDRALGARLTVHTGDHTQTRSVQRTRSYLSQTDPVAHFGLGDHDVVDRVDIAWPDGTSQTLGPLQVDRLHSIHHEAMTPASR